MGAISGSIGASAVFPLNVLVSLLKIGYLTLANSYADARDSFASV